MPKNAHPHMASLKDRTYFFNFPIFVDPIVDYTRFFFSFFFSFFKVRNENQQGLCVVGFGGASQEKNEPTLGFPALR